MPRHRSSLPFRPAQAVLSLVLLIALAACGGASGSNGAEASGNGDSGNAAFPVTLEHKYGSTTIEREPERVVAVGLTEQDALLALGVVPVATTKWIGKYPGEIGPWAQDELGDTPAPEVLVDADGVQFERIAALRPDLILGLYSGLTEDSYNTLSEIAPTVAQPEGYADFGIPWQELTKQVGKAVGRSEQADTLVADVEARFAQARQEHPEFEGATGLMVTPWQGIFVFGPDDPRSYLLTSLGFRLPDGLDQAVGDSYGANLSRERTDLLDTDAIVWIVADVTSERARLHKDGLYGDLDVVREGREVFVKDLEDYGNAISFVSVLSLPLVLDTLVPQLAAAVDGDPATAVPQQGF